MVFIGRAESLDPKEFPWDISLGTRSARRREFEHLAEDKSAHGIALLKDAYMRELPDLDEPYKDRLAHARTSGELEDVIGSLFVRGRRVRFKVEKVFRGPKDGVVEVWTDFSDCGFNFQPGEIYLVYAWREPIHDNRLEAGRCSRTKRLIDAGADLPYLFFYERSGPDSSRVYGFVTSDRRDIERTHVWDSVLHPISDVSVVLKSEGGVRYTNPDPDGRFVFDGLKAGEYSISLFDAGYPGPSRLLKAPRSIAVKTNDCASEVIFLPSRTAVKR